jgi:Ca2+:H+ antiporter
MPRRKLGVGCIQHQIARFRIRVPELVRLQVRRAELPLAKRIIDASEESSFLLILADLKPNLDQNYSCIDNVFFDFRAQLQKASIVFVRHISHHVFNAGAVVPASIEGDDFAGGGEMGYITLKEQLGLFAIGRHGKCDGPEHTRADAFGYRPNGPAFASSVAAFKSDNDSEELLIFVPVAIALEHFAGDWSLLILITSSLAILPLAAFMGRATEQLAEHLGEGVGGLLNATFGNAAELIIAISALHAGLHDVVKASIAGSIIGNILLVLGAAMLAGGLRWREQHFNAAGARSQATMLTLAAIALVLPAAFKAVTSTASESLAKLSVSISFSLLCVYLLYLIYALVTHSSLFTGSHEANEESAMTERWSVRTAALALAGATGLIAWMSEILVGAIEPAAHELGLTNVFVGVFVVAILGNAAEHATAVSAALKNRMDLSLSIAIGLSVQIALFVAPVLVIASLFIGPATLDLAFPAGLVVTVLLSVIITGQVSGDGRSDWIKGAQLLTVYLVLGLSYFFLPSAPQH